MKNFLFLTILFFVSSLQCFGELDQSKMLLKHCEQNFEIEQYLKQKNKSFQGCAQGTLIKTPSGYVSIEQLQYGDVISSVDGDQEIIDIKKVNLDQIVCVQINGRFIYTSKNEQFFLQDGSFKNAADLQSGDYLYGGDCVDTIFAINDPCDCYGLTTEQHGYFIYSNIYVHNFDAATLTAPSLLIGALEIINPVTLLIGIIVPLSIYAVDYYVKHRNCDLQDVVVDNLQAALQDVQSVQQTRNYYEQKRKELCSLYQDLFSMYNGLKLLLKANQNIVTFSSSLLSQFQLNPYNLLPLPNLSVECGYNVVDKQKLLMIRDQELQNLEAKIIDLEVMLAFHINELIERRNEAQSALESFTDEVNKQVTMWNFDLYNISNDVAISNYEAYLKELELLHNLEQKTNEISFIVAYYDRLKNNKIISQSTNISAVLVNQLKLNKLVNDHIASLRTIMFSNINISENLLRNRGLLSLQGINAVRSVVKKEIENKDHLVLAQAKKKKESMKDEQKKLEQKKDNGGGGQGGPEKDPDDKDPLPEDNRSMIMHIFRKIEGHLLDTLENREALRSLVKDPKNYLGRDDRFLRHWYAKITKEGKQFWAWMKDGKIRDGGLNNKPLPWNAETGLCSSIVPKR